MRAIAIIPARMASTRLPGKMLLSETGKPLLAHTIEQVRKASSISQVYVAGDCGEILLVAAECGVNGIYTDPSLPTGTDRVAAAYKTLLEFGMPVPDIVVNVQGDEPEIDPGAIDALVVKHAQRDAEMTTIVAPRRRGSVNAVVDCWDWARIVDFNRDQQPYEEEGFAVYGHVGVYAYCPEFLLRFAGSPQPADELSQSLEQLRALSMEATIIPVYFPCCEKGIDTREDYDAFVERYRSSHDIQ